MRIHGAKPHDRELVPRVRFIANDVPRGPFSLSADKEFGGHSPIKPVAAPDRQNQETGPDASHPAGVVVTWVSGVLHRVLLLGCARMYASDILPRIILTVWRKKRMCMRQSCGCGKTISGRR